MASASSGQSRISPGYVAEGFGAVVDAFNATVADDGRSGAALSTSTVNRSSRSRQVSPTAPRVRSGLTRRPHQSSRPPRASPRCLSAPFLEQGAIASLDIPLANIWPEFAAHGKGAITVGDALAHRAGVSAPRFDPTMEQVADGEIVCSCPRCTGAIMGLRHRSSISHAH